MYYNWPNYDTSLRSWWIVLILHLVSSYIVIKPCMKYVLNGLRKEKAIEDLGEKGNKALLIRYSAKCTAWVSGIATFLYLACHGSGVDLCFELYLLAALGSSACHSFLYRKNSDETMSNKVCRFIGHAIFWELFFMISCGTATFDDMLPFAITVSLIVAVAIHLLRN